MADEGVVNLGNPPDDPFRLENSVAGVVIPADLFGLQPVTESDGTVRLETAAERDCRIKRDTVTGRFVKSAGRKPGAMNLTRQRVKKRADRVRWQILKSFSPKNGIDPQALLRRVAEEDPVAYLQLVISAMPKQDSKDARKGTGPSINFTILRVPTADEVRRVESRPVDGGDGG